MLIERAELSIREGGEAEFAAMMQEKGVPLLAGIPGVHWVKFGRGVENPGKFMLLVHWDSMDVHKAYNAMPECQTFRSWIGGYSVGGAMEHFEMD